eukprot:3977736-Pleurochrysis_carterae.AAC.1
MSNTMQPHFRRAWQLHKQILALEHAMRTRRRICSAMNCVTVFGKIALHVSSGPSPGDNWVYWRILKLR